MRMGRPPPKRKAASPRKKSPKKADTQNPNLPQFSSPTLVVGRVSPNVVASVLAPRLKALAVRSVEAEADRALWASAALNEGDAGGDGGTEAAEAAARDLDGDGAERYDDSSSGPPPSSKLLLFQTQSDIDTLATLLSETSSHFTSGSSHRQLSSWRVGLNAAKFERLLDERYGRFRPLIEAHPQIEVVLKNLQRRYALGGCSPFKDRLPVSTTTGVMLLFMLHRQKVRTDALVLAAVFCLVGLQPWALVTLVALGRWEAGRRSGGRTRGMPRKLTVCRPYYAREGAAAAEEEEEEAAATQRKHALLARPVGTPYSPADLSLRDAEHDALVLGGGAAALYAGALLARAGRRVCVLSPEADASGCATLGPHGQGWSHQQGKAPAGRGDRPWAAVPFDVGAHAVAHLSRQQPLLAPALCTAADAQGGVRFARVGSPADGYAHALVSVPGPGGADAGWEDPVAVTAGGPAALAEYCAARLGDGRPGRAGPDLGGGGGGGGDAGGSASLGYLRACATVAEAAGDHYLSKLLPLTGKADAGGNAYRNAAPRPAAAFLDACLPLSPRVRALAAGLGNPNENAGPADTSLAAHVSHLCANTSEEGMAYPVGGPRALCHALASVIEQCGGRVVTGAGLQELLFEKTEEEEETTTKKKKEKEEKKEEEKEEEKRDGSGEAAAAGPKPRCRGIRLQDGCELAVADGGAVVSTLGLVPTFLHLVPPPVRAAHGVPTGLPAASERRPLLRVLVGLRGAAADLDVTGADWYRLPNATATATAAAAGDGAADGDGEGAEGRGRGKRSKGAAAPAAPRRTKFTAGKSWMKVSFPSAKDPSWPARHAAVTTCVVTIEADDDFVTAFDTRPRLFSILKSQEGAGTRLVDRVMKDLVENFPQLADNIECVQLSGPSRAGLAQNPARFAIPGNRPASPYPGLFVGGAELTVADSFSGAIAGSWLAVNAVVGYSSVDLLYLQKNITSDLARFLEEPDGDGEEDLAVPFESKGARGDGGAAAEKGKEGPTDPAESTKEE